MYFKHVTKYWHFQVSFCLSFSIFSFILLCSLTKSKMQNAVWKEGWTFLGGTGSFTYTWIERDLINCVVDVLRNSHFNSMHVEITVVRSPFGRFFISVGVGIFCVLILYNGTCFNIWILKLHFTILYCLLTIGEFQILKQVCFTFELSSLNYS